MLIDLQTGLWLVRLRWCALAGLIIGAQLELAEFSGAYGTIALVAVALTLAATNVLASINLKSNSGLPRTAVGALLLADVLLLTVVLACNGGPANPFSVLYLVHITLTAAVLGMRWTWLTAAGAVVAYGILFLLHQSGEHSAHMADHLRGMWWAFALASLLVSYFVCKILGSLKRQDSELAQMRISIEQNTRFASLVTLAAGAAHELGSPLATIAVISGELARAANSKPELSAIKEDAALLQEEVARCKKILDDLRFQADSASPQNLETVSSEDLIAALHSACAAEHRPRVHFDFGEYRQPALLPLTALARITASLVSNAVDADRSGAPVIVRAETRAGALMLSIIDSGCGMSEDQKSRAAEPFFTTKAPGKGMGLGLFLARIFCEQHGGRLEIISSPGMGTAVKLHLPLAHAGGSVEFRRAANE